MYVIELNTSRELLLLIFCISQDCSDIFKIRCEIWHEACCKFTTDWVQQWKHF